MAASSGLSFEDRQAASPPFALRASDSPATLNFWMRLDEQLFAAERVVRAVAVNQILRGEPEDVLLARLSVVIALVADAVEAAGEVVVFAEVFERVVTGAWKVSLDS